MKHCWMRASAVTLLVNNKFKYLVTGGKESYQAHEKRVCWRVHRDEGSVHLNSDIWVQVIRNHFAGGLIDANAMFTNACNTAADACDGEMPLTNMQNEVPLISSVQLSGSPPDAVYNFFVSTGAETKTTAKIVWLDMVTCTGALFRSLVFSSCAAQDAGGVLCVEVASLAATA